jgi:hypothetical protein
MSLRLKETFGPMDRGFSTIRSRFLARLGEFRDKSLCYACEYPSHGLPVKVLPPGSSLPELRAAWRARTGCSCSIFREADAKSRAMLRMLSVTGLSPSAPAGTLEDWG